MTRTHSDTAAGRTLNFGINIPGGATVESCTAACTASSSGPFPLSGVENRNECCEFVTPLHKHHLTYPPALIQGVATNWASLPL